jgi:hypothetical protein
VRRIGPCACFDFALRATLSLSGFGRHCTTLMWFDLANVMAVMAKDKT